MDDLNILAVNTNNYNVYSYLYEGETEADLLKRATDSKERDIKNYMKILADFEAKTEYNPDSYDYFKKQLEVAKTVNYKIMTWDEYQKGQRDYLLGDEISEATKEEWDYALNVLPPLYWCTIDGVEMFCMREMYTGTYTTQYARHNGKYYSKMVDCADKSTWIHNLLQ